MNDKKNPEEMAKFLVKAGAREIDMVMSVNSQYTVIRGNGNPLETDPTEQHFNLVEQCLGAAFNKQSGNDNLTDKKSITQKSEYKSNQNDLCTVMDNGECVVIRLCGALGNRGSKKKPAGDDRMHLTIFAYNYVLEETTTNVDGKAEIKKKARLTRKTEVHVYDDKKYAGYAVRSNSMKRDYDNIDAAWIMPAIERVVLEKKATYWREAGKEEQWGEERYPVAAP